MSSLYDGLWYCRHFPFRGGVPFHCTAAPTGTATKVPKQIDDKLELYETLSRFRCPNAGSFDCESSTGIDYMP